MYYYRGLNEWGHVNEYLRDTCITAQDQYKAGLDYFRVAYCQVITAFLVFSNKQQYYLSLNAFILPHKILPTRYQEYALDRKTNHHTMEFHSKKHLVFYPM